MDWHDHYELGKKAFKENNYITALESLEKVVEEKYDFADVYNMLGIIYYVKNRVEDSIKAFEKAIDINPHYTEAALNLSVVYNETGNLLKAQELYLVAKTSTGGVRNTYLDPHVKGKLANMHAKLGSVYKDLGLLEDASREYKKAIELGPDYEDIRMNLGIVYRDMKDFSKAIKTFEGAIEANPDYMPARIQLGLTYYIMGKKVMAKAEWLKVSRSGHKDKMVEFYLNLLKGEK